MMTSTLPLTSPSGIAFEQQVRNTHPGMAHFAGTGPAGLTCRQCTHWCIGALDWYAAGGKHGGSVKPMRCRAFTKFTMGQEGAKVPHDAAACKHFAPNDNPPSIRRPQR